MKPLHVAFLWHMHQPYYKDNLANRYLMPWVRLHSVKGYYDMIDLLEDYPQMRASFNLVPSLMVQILDYCLPQTTDPFLEHTLVPAQALTGEQKEFILTNFFMANWDNMVKPHERYWELLIKRGFKGHGETLKDAVKSFHAKDVRDLQAWANLAWFGYRAKKKYPEISALIEKGKDFTEAEIHRIVEIQREIICQLIPAYKKAFQEARVELTTSAFYHPILPLVYDTDFAKRCLPHAPLPQRFRHPEDARAQVQKGLELFESVFAARPKGLWPSEGSVCPELVPILSDFGIQWIATDEEILFHSDSATDRGKALFKPYQLNVEGRSLNVFFRDRGLSDLIGFTYSQNPSAASAQDFIAHLTRIHQHHADEPGRVVSVILDGENAWEYYKDGGEHLLRGIYQALSENEGLRPVTFSEHLTQSALRQPLSTIHTGSWIHHDFDIWIGSDEENTAWEYLGKTREFVAGLKGLSGEKMKQILDQIYIAEGSDWFWWYGDDFSTDNDELFDQLFRLHLATCYLLAGAEVPEWLEHPIIESAPSSDVQTPIGFIEPEVDGRVSHFYEWHEAGVYHVESDAAMHRAERYIHRIYFGFNPTTFFLRMDPYSLSKMRNPGEVQLEISLTKPSDCTMVIPRAFRIGKAKKFILRPGAETGWPREYHSCAFQEVLEMCVPFADLGLKGGEETKLRIAVSQGGMLLETQPKFGHIPFKVPTKDFEREMWSA